MAGCVDLLTGRADLQESDQEPDQALVIALGGPPARRVLEGRDQEYWLRVWAARGLLWAWQDSDATVEAITGAMSDEAWRVREMAAKVVARNLVGDALTAVSALLEDPVPRVRAAASRAVVALTQERA